VGPRVSMNAVEKRKFCHCRQSNPGRPARHFEGWKYDSLIFVIRSPASRLYPLTGGRRFTVAARSRFINFCYKPPLPGLCLTYHLIDLIYSTRDLSLVSALLPCRSQCCTRFEGQPISTKFGPCFAACFSVPVSDG
jgi:hypothetical protein